MFDQTARDSLDGPAPARIAAALRAFDRWAARHEIEETRGFLVSRPVARELVHEMVLALFAGGQLSGAEAAGQDWKMSA